MPDATINTNIDHEPRAASLWLLVSVLIAIVLVAAARVKGGYVDEYWTLGFAHSALPLKQAFQAWSIDTPHPIGFYAISRVGDLFLAPDIFVRRLTNLLFFGFAILCAWRAPKEARSFDLGYIATVAASPYLVERFAEYRAGFLALMITAVLVLRIRGIAESGGAKTKDAVAISAVMAALGITDYPIAITGMALCGALGLMSLWRRDYRTFLVAAAGISACILLVAFSLANAARFPMAPSPYFQSWPGLGRDLLVVLVTAALPCAVMIVMAVIRFGRSLSRQDALPHYRFPQLLALSLVLMLVAIVIINGATHSLIRRQLFGLIPLAVALILSLCWPYFRQRTASIALVALNLLAVSGAAAYDLKSKPYFDRFGERMARAQGACPTLPIYAILPDRITGNRTNPYPIPNQVELGFADVARRHHFNVRYDVPARWIDPTCGAIIWSEYLWMDSRPTPELIERQLGLGEQMSAGTTVEYVNQSLMMRVPPR